MGLLSTSSNARAENELLDLLVVQDEVVTLLESLHKAQPIQPRLYSFFKRNNVKRPEYFASLIAKHPMPNHKKKLIAAMLVVESHGDTKAVSRKGAQGILQIMPFWKKVLKIKGSLKDPVVNLDAGSRVYDIHLKEANGNQRKGLIAYSGGSKWYPNKISDLVKQI